MRKARNDRFRNVPPGFLRSSAAAAALAAAAQFTLAAEPPKPATTTAATTAGRRQDRRRKIARRSQRPPRPSTTPSASASSASAAWAHGDLSAINAARRQHRRPLRHRLRAARQRCHELDRPAPSTPTSATCSSKEKDIDAVVVSTPDHTHALAAMMAMQMGKHVYCEKPLTYDIYEARMLTEAARKHGVKTQMGNQGTRQRRDPPAGRVRPQRHRREHQRSARLHQPPDLAAGPGRADQDRPAVPEEHQLGLVARPRAVSAVSPGKRLSAVQVARLVGFRHRRAGRHGVPPDATPRSGRSNLTQPRGVEAIPERHDRSTARRTGRSSSTSSPSSTADRR